MTGSTKLAFTSSDIESAGKNATGPMPPGFTLCINHKGPVHISEGTTVFVRTPDEPGGTVRHWHALAVICEECLNGLERYAARTGYGWARSEPSAKKRTPTRR